mmetsp:Transcript_9646/g.18227  ORF Transcript_9646/g.18227 Transcript_9646/m.18227 type:complete len:82 (+) Transcript_9646:817-1062(+)
MRHLEVVNHELQRSSLEYLLDTVCNKRKEKREDNAAQHTITASPSCRIQPIAGGKRQIAKQTKSVSSFCLQGRFLSECFLL